MANCMTTFPLKEPNKVPFHEFDDGSVFSEELTKVLVVEHEIPAGETHEITRVIGTAASEGLFSWETDSVDFGNMSVTPANETISFSFDPPLPISGPKTLQLFFTSNADNPEVQVYGSIMGQK